MIVNRVLFTFGILLVVVLGVDAIAACWNLATMQPTPAVPFASHPLSKSRPNTSLLETDEIVSESFNSFQFFRFDATNYYIEEFYFKRSGEGIYRFIDFRVPDYPVMQTEIKVNEWEIAAICAILRNADFCTLDDRYEADIPIQHWMAIHVESQGVAKQVACYEHYPKRFTRIVKYLDRSFLPSFGLHARKYEPMPEDEADQWKHFMIGMPLPDDWATQKDASDK
ncbi:hypothetical protein [Bremerella sp. P1]|uniref:hypothetical protein n=1 Tax=Bremerella sp. P1 TaxID=3026424 RepID=UPI0023675136|nr:hypothetical protein [Bremerella sp. P1]WDI44320.1 hypothetical protein PSR63_10295 [Bremerella sp. P1]